MNYYLSLAALVPAVILFVRIYQLDRIEKEPRRLLGILLLSGALLALPAAGIQLLASRTLGSALNRRSAVFLLLDNFLVVAVSEEVCKIVPVRLAAWKHPAFDYRFDAVVYSVSSALGFAAVENILYVVQSDLRTAVSRAVLSVPGHFFFAVAMGLLLSRGKQAEKQGNGRRRTVLCALAILMPVAARDLGRSACRPQTVGDSRVLLLCGRVFHRGGPRPAPRFPDGQPPVKGMFSEWPNRNRADCVAVCPVSVL